MLANRCCQAGKHHRSKQTDEGRLIQKCVESHRKMPGIPGRRSRGKPIKYNKRRYKRRNRIKIMFGRLQDWGRVATRYIRCPKVFLSAIAPGCNRHVLARQQE